MAGRPRREPGGTWSEERLHRWLARRAARPGGRPPALAGSSGHDAAVLHAARGRDVICVDQTVAGVHFEVGTGGAAAGRKAAARALSDLAATAARPRALVLALRAPGATPEAWMRAAIAAVDREGRRHGAALVGGDLCLARGPLSLTVTALGSAPGRGRPPGRDRARPGQIVLLTGPVGGSRLGRHLRFRPRVAEGAWLARRGATALMDVSDGLALDLARLARASGVRVDLERVPVHRDARRAAQADGRSAREHALGDGEDHELLATLPQATLARVRTEAPRCCPGLVEVGRVRAGSGLWIAGEDGALARWDGADGTGGWVHGGRA